MTYIYYWFDDDFSNARISKFKFDREIGSILSWNKIPDWLTTGTHILSVKIISEDGTTSNILNATFTYICPAIISISDMLYNSQKVVLIGNISLKGNPNAKRVNASFRDFTDSSKSILLNDGIDKYQYFDIVLQFPSNLNYGIHIIDIIVINENDIAIGKKSFEFNYIKQPKGSYCMNIQSYIRRR